MFYRVTEVMKRTGLILGAIALMIVAFYAMTFYPGYMSFDSAYHYRQLETGEWTTFQPVIILLFWKITDALISGPGGLFLLFLSVYVLSLWLLSCYVQGGWTRRLLLLFSALLPVNVMLFPHIWKDIGLLVFTLLAVALVVVFLTTQRRSVLWGSFISLWIAVLFRFEAILYLLPLVFFQVQQLCGQRANNHSLLRKNHDGLRHVIGVALFFAVALLGNKGLVAVSHSQKVTLWPTVALWDIARVSVRENQQLLPPFTVGPAMTVEDLAQATYDWTNTSLFSNTKAGVNNGLGVPYAPEQYRQLLTQWITLPLKYPVSYAKHRLRLASDLLRVVESPNKPQDLFWINQMMSYGEHDYRQRFPINHSQLNKIVNHFLVTRKDDMYFKPWFYLLLAIGIIVYVLRTPQASRQQRLAGYLTLSAVLSVGVMCFLAPAAEQRYLIILFNVVPISLCLAWKNRDRTTS